jgi:hypothetical protein
VERPELDNIGSSVDGCEDRRLVLRRRRGAKKRNQDIVRSRQKLSAARKRVIVAPSLQCKKETFVRVQAGTTLQEEHLRERCLGRDSRSTVCENGRLDRNFKDQLCLRMRRTSSRNYRTPMQLEVENRRVGSMTGVQDEIYWTFWKIRPPPKHKKEVRTA